MSSRVRLARDLKDSAFPGWAKKPERIRVMEMMRLAVEALPEMRAAFSQPMDSLSTLDNQILVERHLISREHAANRHASGLSLYLPRMRLAEQINPTMQSVKKLGLAVRRLYGEGTDGLGKVFHVTNQMTLGESESAIAERREKVPAQTSEKASSAPGTVFAKK